MESYHINICTLWLWSNIFKYFDHVKICEDVMILLNKNTNEFWQKHKIIILASGVISKKKLKLQSKHFKLPGGITPDLKLSPYYDFEINFHHGGKLGLYEVQNRFIDDIIEFYEAHPHMKEYYKFSQLFCEDLDARRELHLLRIFKNCMDYSEKYILSIYDNYTRVNYALDETYENVAGHNNAWIDNDIPYYCSVTNHPLWTRNLHKDTITDIFLLECKVRAIFLVKTSPEFDKISLEAMKCDVTSLKISKDRSDWYEPTKENIRSLSGIQALKMGYSNDYSESAEDQDASILSSYLNAWNNLQLFWVWGFPISWLFQALSEYERNLYSVKYSQTSFPIEGIKLEIRSLDINILPGHIFMHIQGKEYSCKFSKVSCISVRLDENIDIFYKSKKTSVKKLFKFAPIISK